MNSKNMIKTALMALLGLSLALPVVGFASEPDEQAAYGRGMRGHGMRGMGPQGAGPGARIHRIMSRLDLDEAQQENVRAIVEAGREAGEPLREQHQQAMTALRELAQDESASDRALSAAVDAVIEARAALQQHRMSIRDQVREVLTPSQQAQLVLMGDGRGKPPRGRRGPPPQGPTQR